MINLEMVAFLHLSLSNTGLYNSTPQTRISTQEVQVNTCYNLQLEETMNQLQEVHGYKRYMCYNLLLTTGGDQEPDTISTTRVTQVQEVQVKPTYKPLILLL